MSQGVPSKGIEQADSRKQCLGDSPPERDKNGGSRPMKDTFAWWTGKLPKSKTADPTCTGPKREKAFLSRYDQVCCLLKTVFEDFDITFSLASEES